MKTTYDKKNRDATTNLYLISLTIIAVATVVFPSMIQYGYSQKSNLDNGISLLSSSSFTAPNEDGLEYYHIVGEVKNNSPTDSMNNVKIVATFYDSARRVVGTDFTYTNVDVIRPAEKSSFEIILDDQDQSQKVDSYKLSVSSDVTEALPAALKLSVGESNLDSNSTDAYHIVGQVTNQGSQKATFVKVSGAFYNSDNKVVAAGYAYTTPQDLQPGQTAPFEIKVHGPTANEITSASLNVNSKEYSSVIQNERDSIAEIAPGQSVKGSVDTTPSGSSSSQTSTSFNANSPSENSNDNANTVAVPHAVVNKSIFNKGLSDGQKDAKTDAKMNAKAMTPTTSSDDIDCESPDNLSGQDSIDYCKGYDQGFTEQNNIMAQR